MAMIDLNDGDARLSDLVGRVEAGETLEIARHGQVVAKLVSAAQSRKPIDFDALARLRARTPMTSMTVEDMRRLDLL